MWCIYKNCSTQTRLSHSWLTMILNIQLTFPSKNPALINSQTQAVFHTLNTSDLRIYMVKIKTSATMPVGRIAESLLTHILQCIWLVSCRTKQQQTKVKSSFKEKALLILNHILSVPIWWQIHKWYFRNCMQIFLLKWCVVPSSSLQSCVAK